MLIIEPQDYSVTSDDKAIQITYINIRKFWRIVMIVSSLAIFCFVISAQFLQNIVIFGRKYVIGK